MESTTFWWKKVVFVKKKKKKVLGSSVCWTHFAQQIQNLNTGSKIPQQKQTSFQTWALKKGSKIPHKEKKNDSKCVLSESA